MKKSLSVLALYLVLASGAGAQESAELVQTSGAGELSRASDAMIEPGGQNLSVHLPATVGVGEVISIQYHGAGTTVSDSFMVTGISIRDDRCALENKRDTKAGHALSDMIYTRPCKKLR